jgi:hypothetical protein
LNGIRFVTSIVFLLLFLFNLFTLCELRLRGCVSSNESSEEESSLEVLRRRDSSLSSDFFDIVIIIPTVAFIESAFGFVILALPDAWFMVRVVVVAIAHDGGPPEEMSSSAAAPAEPAAGVTVGVLPPDGNHRPIYLMKKSPS